MRKNIITSSLFMFLSILLFTGCNNEEPYQSLHPSPRDGVYEGKNLSVTIDGIPVPSIKSVRIFSEIIGYAEETIVGGNPTDISTPIFHTTVIFKGFPGVEKQISLKTVSTLDYFDGKFNYNGTDGIQYYEYSGIFTGNPESPHSEQGLILEFTLIDPSLNN